MLVLRHPPTVGGMLKFSIFYLPKVVLRVGTINILHTEKLSNPTAKLKVKIEKASLRAGCLMKGER
jgi:hypothetical protein